MRLSTITRPAPDPAPAPAAANGSTAPAGSRPRRRRILAVSAAAVVAAAAVGTLVAGQGGGTTATSASIGTKSAEVVRRDLVVTENYDGALGYGEATSITAGQSGVVTGVASTGTLVEQGETLFHVDLQPAVLLYGAVPAFRELSVDSEPGADVAQLEQALVDLGYGSGITVDKQYTSTTAAAVKRWETALDRFDPDGVISRGDVVFRPGAVRVSAITAQVGTQVKADSNVLDATPTAKVVTANVNADAANRLAVGAAVGLELPDGAQTTGKITSIGPETTSSQGGPGTTSTVAVTITLDDLSAADGFDSGGVEIVVERSRVDDATAVPVTALLALTEGGYAVQVVDSTTASGYRLVGVKVGTYADDYVQVTGSGLEPGIKVLVPR